MPDLQMPLHRNEWAASDARQSWNMIQGEKTLTLVRGRAGGGAPVFGVEFANRDYSR